MADDNWATVRIGIPVELTAAADVLNSVIEFLIAIANVALATLEVVKALLIGLLDPFRTILEQLIAVFAPERARTVMIGVTIAVVSAGC